MKTVCPGLYLNWIASFPFPSNPFALFFFGKKHLFPFN